MIYPSYNIHFPLSTIKQIYATLYMVENLKHGQFFNWCCFTVWRHAGHGFDRRCSFKFDGELSCLCRHVFAQCLGDFLFDVFRKYFVGISLPIVSRRFYLTMLLVWTLWILTVSASYTKPRVSVPGPPCICIHFLFVCTFMYGQTVKVGTGKCERASKAKQKCVCYLLPDRP